MFERFTADARAVVVQAQHHARRLGHRYVGSEHVLLALAGIGQPAGAVLRDRGITPDRVEGEIVRQAGLGAAAPLFSDLDRDALAAIGIDVDAVRAKIEAAFGPDALSQAGQAVNCRRRPAGRRPSRRSPRRALPPGVVRAWRRARRAATTASRPGAAPPPGAAASRSRGAPGDTPGPAHNPAPSGHIPFTPGSKAILQNSLREAQARRDNYLGVEHIALAVIATRSGLVPPILSALGASEPALRAAILDRYRAAG